MRNTLYSVVNGFPLRALSSILVAGIGFSSFAQQVDDEETSLDEEPDLQLAPGQRYYYGDRGRPVVVDTVPDKIGVEFFAPVRASDVDERFANDSRVRRPAQEELTRNRDLGTMVIVRLDARATRAQADTFRADVRAMPGVRAAHPVVRTVHADGSRGKESLVTGRISILTRGDYPEKALEELFAQDGAVIVQRIPFSRLNRVGYIVEIDTSIAETKGEDTFSIASRYHRTGAILHATPDFAPMYRMQTGVPGDKYYHEPTTSSDPRWYFERVSAQAAWERAYGSGFPTTPNDDFADRTVIAAIDNGVAMDYQDRTLNPTPLGAPCSPCVIPLDFPDDQWLAIGPVAESFPNTISGHPDLNPNQWFNLAEINGTDGDDDDNNGYVDDYFGWDFVGNDPLTAIGDAIPFPDYYGNEIYDDFRVHGTATIGISAAQVETSTSTDETRGTPGYCPTCLIMPIRYHVNTFDPGDTYGATDVFNAGRIAQAINYAADTGAHVMKVMVGTETFSPLMKAAVDNARMQGVFIAVPASNDGQSLDARPLFPQVWPEVMVAGATDDPDINDPMDPNDDDPIRRTLNFEKEEDDAGQAGSNYGWAVDITAPVDGFENFPTSANSSGIMSPKWNGNANPPAYVTQGSGGTSSAVPQLAGLAGLVLETNPLLSPMEVQFIISESATDIVYTRTDFFGIGFDEDAGVGRDRYTGFGEINMDYAVKLAKAYLDSYNDTVYFKIPDTRREGGDRSILSFHDLGTETATVVDGSLVFNATTTELSPTGATGEEWWREYNGVVKDSADDPGLGGTYVARLAPPAIDSLGNPKPATLYLKDVYSLTMSPPAGSWSIDTPNLVQVAAISPIGKLYVRSRVPLDIPWSDLLFGTPRAYTVAGTAGLQSVLNSGAQNGDVLLLFPGTYGSITIPSGLEVVLRSFDPHDPESVASTIFEPTSGRAITFGGGQTDESAVIGFTFLSGGIDANGTSPRIIGNAFEGCASDRGGAIRDAQGLIEGNLFRLNTATVAGGVLFNCDGIIIKNIFDQNSAGVGADGGALSGCQAQIYQNFFVENSAGDDGGALSNCAGDINGNIFYKNSSTDRGGAIYLAEVSVAFEQNTLVANTAGQNWGGGTDRVEAPDGMVRNNIYWNNTAGGQRVAQSDQLNYGEPEGMGENTGYPYFSVVEDYTTDGDGNIAVDPLFITDQLKFREATAMFDDFNDGDHDGWTVDDWNVDDGIMKPIVENEYQSFEDSVTEPKVQARFRYRMEIDNTAHYLAFRPLDINSTGEKIEVAFYTDKVQLREHDGTSWINVQTKTEFDSDINTWYEVFVIVEQDDPTTPTITTVEVWRRGEHESDITQILFRDDLELLTTERRMFRINPNSNWWVDDVGWDLDNFDYFLHLSKPVDDADDTPIDSGDPEKGIGDLSDFIDFERDFDDVFRPYDILDFHHDLNPTDPLQPAEDPHDMGAKEYPIPAASLYWWANPLFSIVVE